MIDPAQISDEVVEVAAKGLCLAQGYDWDRHPDFHPAWRKEARAVIAAGLNAWPGAKMRTTFGPNDNGVWVTPHHGWLLPLHTGARDDR